VPFSPSQQPRLTWWSHTWRTLAMLLVSGAALTTMAEDERAVADVLVVVDVVLGVAAFVLVFLRRRWPVPVAVLTTLFSGLSGLAAGASLLAVVSLSTRRRWREIVPVAVLSVLTGALYAVLWPGSLVTGGSATASVLFQAGVSVPFIGATVAWGMYVGSRRELLWTLRDRARRAEDEQATRVAQARTAERARIAREMHDVLAHRISLVTMHADAMVYRTDLDAGQLRSSAAVIQDSSHRALVELREVLGVLREDAGDAAPERPQPGARDVPAMVQELVADGVRVDARLEADLDGVPDTTGRTLYRVVQEGLTNARKHAPHSRVALTVTGRPGTGLDVEVSNPLGPGDRSSAPDSGLGLVGLAERATLAGGRIEHGTVEGRFVLSAWLPWPS
jgi:signal transduction histidine kinase